MVEKHCPTCGVLVTEANCYGFVSRRSYRCKACCKTQSKNWALANPAKKAAFNKASTKKWRRKLRIEVLTHYSSTPYPSCVCCEETHIEFLAVDHIAGGGEAQRTAIGGPDYFYHWLRKNNFPEGFRVLCHNCNMSLGFYKYCPHNKEVV